ncbi:hypothetical protein PQX77_012145 [Marasmius sp. AFHP31]|nr:hypothetical protein PQX77_012145 [Marasmius sp. AFHP31]
MPQRQLLFKYKIDTPPETVSKSPIDIPQHPMSYLPPRQPGEQHLTFVRCTLSSIRYDTPGQYKAIATCYSGGPQHQLRVHEDRFDERRFGDQYLSCPDRRCSPPLGNRSLDADERDLINHLMRSYQKYELAHSAYCQAVTTRNTLSDPHSADIVYWLARFLYLQRLDEFKEALKDSNGQRNRYYFRRHRVHMTKDHRRLVKAVTILDVPVLHDRCRPVEDDDQTLQGSANTPTRPRPPKRGLIEVLDEFNQSESSEPAKKRRRQRQSDTGLRTRESGGATATSSHKGKGKGKDRAASPTMSTLTERAASKRKRNEPDFIVISDDNQEEEEDDDDDENKD